MPVLQPVDPSHPETERIPPELDRWNWGAFLLNWIWGAGNNTWIALLVFVPVLGWIIMPFVLGAKGSAWAWRNATWRDAAHFRRAQRRWAIWGVVVWILTIAAAGATVFGVLGALRSSEAYRMGLARVQNDPRAVSLLGSPITGGQPMGNITISGAGGSAELTFTVSGPKGSGEVAVGATRDLGDWHLRSLQLRPASGIVDILTDPGASGPAPVEGGAGVAPK